VLPLGISSVSILCDPKDYDAFLSSYSASQTVPDSLRNSLALKAFTVTSTYDTAISNYFRKQYASADGIDNANPEDKAGLREAAQQLTLRYGINPHQKPAQAFVKTGKLPFSGAVYGP
jgi:phosphoribosylaminoimidazolecarboxamide formyltransferase/IMP cyclohydrolase